MVDNETPTIETEEFAKLFRSIKGVIQIIPWIGKEAIGVSVLKKYPNKSFFVPVINKSDQQDSVALIKVGYNKDSVHNNERKVLLTVSISKASHYIFAHHWYNYADTNSPSEEAVKRSEESRQPVNLEDSSRYEFHIAKNRIYDLETKRYVSANSIVNDIYNKHLKTLIDIGFRSKMAVQKKVIELIDPINDLLRKINLVFFGKTLKKSKNFSVGIYAPYAQGDLIDLELTSEKPKILGSDFPITYQSATTFIIVILLTFLLNYWFKYDFLGLVSMIKEASKNSLFLAALTGTLLLFFDRVIPRLILLIINLLIRAKLRLTFLKIKIS